MFLPFRWVAGNERGEKSYVAAILCCAARANLEGVASCSTTLSSSSTSGQDSLPRPVPPVGFYAAPSRRILLLLPSPSHPRLPSSTLLLPCQTHEPIDCRFCIICQDPNSLMHVPLRCHLTPSSLPPSLPLSVPFLYSLLTYSALLVFSSITKETYPPLNLFTAKNVFPRSLTKIDVPREMTLEHLAKI